MTARWYREALAARPTDMYEASCAQISRYQRLAEKADEVR